MFRSITFDTWHALTDRQRILMVSVNAIVNPTYVIDRTIRGAQFHPYGGAHETQYSCPVDGDLRPGVDSRRNSSGARPDVARSSQLQRRCGWLWSLYRIDPEWSWKFLWHNPGLSVLLGQ